MLHVCLVATPGQNWEQQWSYLLSHFEFGELYVIGELDRRVRPFQRYQTIDTAEQIPHECGPLVLLAPANGRYVQGDEALPGFHHPDDCCYMFGADNAIMSEDYLGTRIPDHKVFIPTASADTMYSFMAGAMTFYDRMLKRG